MKTAFVVASLLGTPIVPDVERTREGPMVDDAAMVRAFHAHALVATGGDFALDLVPVQTQGPAAFLMSDAFPSADAPMDAGEGWLLFRDGVGNTAILMVDAETTLRDLEVGLDGAANLEAEFAIAFDGGGAHLVGVLDDAGQEVFRQEYVEYRPAPSLVTDAMAVFPAQRGVAFPERTFSEDGEHWPIDPAAQWSSAPHDGLWMLEADRNELLNAALPSSEGWEPFVRLVRPEYGPDGWVLPPVRDTSSALASMTADFGRAWGDQDVEWYSQDSSHQWFYAGETLDNIEDTLKRKLEDYGITPRVR